MFKIIGSLLLFALSSFHFATASELIIENVTVISSHLDKPQENQFVRVVDGRISAVSDKEISPVSSDALKIDGKGKYLTYGLMDSHVHVNSVPGIGFIKSDKAKQYPQLISAYLHQQPKSFLYYGVTQVLNLGANDGEKIFTKGEIHPEYFSCKPIPIVGGYPDLDAKHTLTHSDFFIVEPGITKSIPASKSHSEQTPEKVVARIAETGAPCIKLYFENGFSDASDWPMLLDETVAKIRTEATKHGLQLVAHANAIDMYHHALANDVDIFAHGLWNWNWPKDKGAPPVADTLDRLMAGNVGYMPTIHVMQALKDMFADKLVSDKERKLVLPKSLLTWFETDEGQWFRNELKGDFPPDMQEAQIYEMFNYGFKRALQSTKYLADHDYPMILASDFPSSPSFAAAPGLSTYHELLNMHDAGVSLKAILDAATVNGPIQFEIATDYGTVERGKIANMLLLNSDPLINIQAWQDIETIIIRGNVVSRDSLTVR
ncbi:amidohydrolase family protein [Alteromonas sp. ASW11-130]|uniref:amidohydrolase family protein n=1 Tax=Alteromonas sp. ASW11-130 TaxID=3015775 RepID=UPI00224206A3|nr:amidohydrolase family protein [Alteromonas sp. ASW11-130]MCW8092846.1 amidohydrolase family protein [Alteromonas sp. ASW11-130]